MTSYNFRRYEREVVAVSPDASALSIADAMDEHSIGCVVVVDGEGRPLGIATDRDLVRRVVAAGRDPEKTRAADVMTTELVVAGRDESSPAMIEKMRKQGVRRLPVLADGRVVSLVSLDDLLFDISSALFNMTEGTRAELRESHRTARLRRRHEAREEALEELRSALRELRHEARKRLRSELASLLGKRERHRPSRRGRRSRA
jgi:CBS domain-containing protein